MRRSVIVSVVLLLLSVAAMAGQRVKLGTITDDLRVTVDETSYLRTVVRFEIGAFEKETIEIDGENYNLISCAKEGVIHIEGEPELPRLCRSIIIPDDAKVTLKVLSAEYIDFPIMPTAPSKGNLKRTVNPADIPYTFGSVYSKDEWYPSQLAKLREPFILRDFRGTVIEIYPFQYNPASKTLRVYSSVIVEVVPDGPGEINVKNRQEPFSKVTPDFELIYKKRFINYNTGILTYTPVTEEGDMLIITYDSFHEYMTPLVEWKRQKGIKTTIVDVSTIGNYSSNIKGFIQAFYDSTDLAWVLLVGDAAQVATPYASGGASDPSYAKVDGGDDYPDIIVGRFSAENSDHVQTQVERTINYEKFPQAGADWYHMAAGVASDEGPGHNGEYDFQHLNYIRDDLLGYNYTLVDQIYDPGASISQVNTALNSGRSFVNYTGHGGPQSWSTTGFSNSHVNSLTNDNMLPFIISVACNNGQFDTYTCFGEAWLRATHDGNPSGAMGAYMSTIGQSWTPPMHAQDEATDLLVAESKLTFGGICYNGSCLTIEIEGNDGVEIYDTWHIFGDPSVKLCTDTPTTMAVNHDNTVIFTATEFYVITGFGGALCALYHDGVMYGSGYTDTSGMAAISITEVLPVGQEITLTVTDYNRITYTAGILVIAPDGPYVVYDSHTINDAVGGNNNGLVDFGESILLGMQLINVGPDMAYNVSISLACADPYITITDAVESFTDVPGDNGTAYRSEEHKS